MKIPITYEHLDEAIKSFNQDDQTKRVFSKDNAVTVALNEAFNANQRIEANENGSILIDGRQVTSLPVGATTWLQNHIEDGGALGHKFVFQLSKKQAQLIQLMLENS